MSARQPKTGQRRKVNKPLKIDRLPQAMRDRILVERNTRGRTWAEMVEDSPHWPEWQEVPEGVALLFPQSRLPKDSLRRWYDLRVEQVQRDVMERAAQAREIAAVFAKAAVKGSDQAVLNGARDLIFGLLRPGDDKGSLTAAKGLIALGEVMQSARANSIKERKLALDERRITQLEKDAEQKRRRLEKETDQAAHKLEKGELTVADLNRLRERTFGLPPIGLPG